MTKLGDVRYVYTWAGERVFKVVSFYLFRYRRAGSGRSPRSRDRGRRGPLVPARGRSRAARLQGRARNGGKGARVHPRQPPMMRPLPAPCRHVRTELLLADGRRPAAQPPQDGDHPPGRQVPEVQEGHGRAGAGGRPLRPARQGLRRRHRQGRGEAARASSRRKRSSTTTPKPGGRRSSPPSWASSTTARSRRTSSSP